MAGGKNHRSKQIKSQYFTPPEYVRKCLEVIRMVWGQDWRKGTELGVLEPAAGCGTFIIEAEGLWDLPGINWHSNDLYPENNNWEHDSTVDFLTHTWSNKFDMVIGNPPFSGKVEYAGKKMDMPTAFIHSSFLVADKVAMVLPANYKRPYYRSLLPEGVQMITCTAPEWVTFDTPDGDKKVRSIFALFEVTAESERPMYPMSEPIPGFRRAKDYNEATHAICMWGNAGDCRGILYDPHRLKPWAYEELYVIENPEILYWLLDDGLVSCIRNMSSLETSSLLPQEVWDYVKQYSDGLEASVM